MVKIEFRVDLLAIKGSEWEARVEDGRSPTDSNGRERAMLDQQCPELCQWGSAG